jgi:hypothetical protein
MTDEFTTAGLRCASNVTWGIHSVPGCILGTNWFRPTLKMRVSRKSGQLRLAIRTPFPMTIGPETGPREIIFKDFGMNAWARSDLNLFRQFKVGHYDEHLIVGKKIHLKKVRLKR